MRFTIIYENIPEARAEIEKMILKAAEMGFAFDERQIQHHIFKTFLNWPTKEELSQFPFNIQVEMVEIKDGKLISLRKLVTDVEEIKPPL